MVKPSSANMMALMASLQASASDACWNFLQSEDQATYANALAAVQSWVTQNAANINGLRVVLTLADGTVAVDTSKNNNSFSNFQSKIINENHNSRIAILCSLLSNSGISLETKFSTTTRSKSYDIAQRMGQSPEESIGCLRISISLGN